MTLIEFILHSLALALIASGQGLGVHIATRKGMLLGFINDRIFAFYERESADINEKFRLLSQMKKAEHVDDEQFAASAQQLTDRRNTNEKKKDRLEFALKPFINCPPCMASVYGTLTFAISLAFWPLPLPLAIWSWFIVVTSAAYINKLLNKAIQ